MDEKINEDQQIDSVPAERPSIEPSRFGFLRGASEPWVPDDFDHMDEQYIYQLFSGEQS